VTCLREMTVEVREEMPEAGQPVPQATNLYM
jgi:hypothetical protein